MGEPAYGLHEAARTVERAEDGLTRCDRGALKIGDQEEDREVLVGDVDHIEDPCALFRANGMAEDEQIDRPGGEDPLDFVQCVAGAHIKACPLQEQLSCPQEDGIMPVDENVTVHTAGPQLRGFTP